MRRSLSILARSAAGIPRNNGVYFRHSIGQRFCGSASAKDQSEASDTEKTKLEETSAKPEEIDEDSEYHQATEALAKAEAQAKALHHNLLLKYADAENKRRERVEELKKLDARHVTGFGNKVSAIYDSLCKVCETAKAKSEAPSAEDKVKSLSEGLMMTRDIMKNILVKHSIVKSDYNVAKQ